jgi:hypothetical protein
LSEYSGFRSGVATSGAAVCPAMTRASAGEGLDTVAEPEEPTAVVAFEDVEGPEGEQALHARSTAKLQ